MQRSSLALIFLETSELENLFLGGLFKNQQFKSIWGNLFIMKQFIIVEVLNFSLTKNLKCFYFSLLKIKLLE